MTTLTTHIPDVIYQQYQQLAQRENMPLDHLIALALSAQISAWMTKDYLEERAKRGDWHTFERILARVPDIEAEEHDRL